MTLATFLVLAVTVACAGFAQGAAGIGFALIAAPVLGYLRPDLMPVALLILMVPLNFYVAWRERGAIDLSGAGWVTAGRVLGTFGGVWVLAALPVSALSLLIGWSTIAAVLVSFAAPAFAPGRGAFATAGLVTGVTETATGVGGPPLALVYQHHAPQTVRSTIAICFLVGEVVSLAVLAVSGLLTVEQATFAAGLFPALAVGAFASRAIHGAIDARRLRLVVLVFALLSGVVLVLG